jgi:autotransporter-associated beta strand protein
MSRKLNLSSALGIFLIGILLSSISEGFSQTTNYFTWNNSTNTWSTLTAWTPNGGPQSSSATANTNVAVFAATGVSNNTVLLGNDRTVYGLIFTNGANAYTFGSVSTAKQLDIMNGMGLQNVSGQNQIFNLAVANSTGNGVWSNSVGSTTTFNNGINLTTASSTANRTLTLGGAGTWNVASTIANGGAATNPATAGAVTVTATGTTTLSGNNTYDGLTTMNAAGGTLTLSGDNSGAAGGVTLTAGTLNINNNNALGSGALTLGANTINNTSGTAVVNAGNHAWAWTDGLAFGSSTNTAANNLNLGTGVVTASSTRTIALAGSGTKLTIGAVNITSTASGRTITANGVGNTLEMGGLTLSASPTATTVTLAGTANLGVTGAIVNGTAPGNGLTVTATGTTTLSGNNTYTGLTTMNAVGGTLTLSGNNSLASGGVTLSGGTLNINNNNALGTGLFSFGNSGNATTIDNTSGSAVVNAGGQAMIWNGTTALSFGSAASTAANNLNLGTGTVTLSGSRTVNLLGTGTTLTMADVIGTVGTSITANGAGNTLEMKGLSLSTSATPVTVSLAGTANLKVTGAIVNGTTPGNGLTVTGTGTKTLSGTNTYTGLTTMNASGGTLNLTGNNSSATGGTVLTTGTLNINNANALSTGLLELSAVTGTAYGSSIINNTSGGALTFSGLSGVRWSGVSPAGIQFGTSGSTSANNMDFGTGLVTAATDRSMNIAGTGVTISMGTLTTSGTAASYTYKIDGAGNTLDLDGWRISGAASPTQAVQHKISGTANVNIGTIENGTGAFANGVGFNNDGVTRLNGNNTYTGATEFTGSGTNIISGNNSAAVGNVTIAGTSGSGKTPVVRLDNVNGISSSSSLLGASGSAQTGTLDLRAAGNFSLNSFGTVSKEGNNMIFTNSSGSQKTLAFTAADNYITLAASGGKTLYNNSANLLLDFNGNIEIGGASTAAEATTFAGVGNFNVDGNLLDTGNGLTRALRKQGDGTLTLRGSANSIRGSTLVETGTLDLYGNLTASTGIVVSTSGTSANTGVRTANATINVRDDASLLSSSTTTVWSRGNLIVNGTAGNVVLENNGLLGGSGTVGEVTLKSGSLLNPGNSPGKLTAASSIWKSGSTYNWEINQASGGTAGVNWDLFDVTNALDLSALSSTTQMNLVLQSLPAMDDYSATSQYSWVFAQAGSLVGAGGVQGAAFIAGANVTDLFNINATAFNAGVGPANGWRVEVGSTGTTLNLMAVPEPSTGSMLGLGLAGLVVTRLLRRKTS